MPCFARGLLPLSYSVKTLCSIVALGFDGHRAAAVAEDHFRQALDWARRQGALSWELRCATSLARLWRNQARSNEARELLAPIYNRFTEGFDTADLKAAKSLLDDLS
jgi:predicted ATPase